MRKVLAIMLMILCGFAFVGSGIVLLSGCSSSQTENGGGGISGPSEDETIENPNDQEDNENEDVDDGTDVGDESGSSDQDDEEIGNDALYFYLRVGTVTRTGSGTSDYEVTNYNESGETYVFDVYWSDENGNAQEWGNGNPKKDGSTSVATSSSSATGCGSFSYQYDNSGFLGMDKLEEWDELLTIP